MARFVITGGAGFIGSHAAEHFAARGHEVVVVDNLSRGTLLQKADPNATAQLGLSGGDSRDRDGCAATCGRPG